VTGTLPLVRSFFVFLSHAYLVAYKEQPVFEYLDNNYGAILGGHGDVYKGIRVYKGSQSTFPPFYKKRFNGSMVL
jgi:hypothetical protein